MIAISWYIIKVLIVSGILTGYYFLALKDKVFHRWNRFYLLLTVCLSLLLPLVSINIFSGGSDQGNIARALQTITMQDEIVIEMGKKSALNANVLLMFGYLFISLFFLVRLIRCLIQIARLKNRYPNTKVKGINFINTNEKGTLFSFFQDIFWNRSIDLHTTPGQQIFNHEVAHITEKHTYDKLFLNTILLLFWINPFFWLIRKELNMIHEFVADKRALEDGDTNAFAEMILSTVFTRQQFAITNNFFYSPIKRRLLMLTKNKHAKVNYISRLLVLPLATIVFVGISCKVKMDTENLKTPDQINKNEPLDSGRNLLNDSMPAMYNGNKKVVAFDVITPGGNETLAKVKYDDGSEETLTFKEAEALGIRIPPPPPPPPPPTQFYKGKALKYASWNTNENKVKIFYGDGTEEKISLEEARQAKLDFIHFTPPKVKKDSVIRFTAPKVVKDNIVPFTPPKVIKDKETSHQDLSGQDKVFTKVEQEATFPGGPQKWAQFIQKAVSAEIDLFSDKDFGTCVVKFLVDKNGNVSDVTATTMQGTQLAKVAADAIKNGPKWIPALQNGIPVNAYRLQPVTLTNPEVKQRN